MYSRHIPRGVLLAIDDNVLAQVRFRHGDTIVGGVVDQRERRRGASPRVCPRATRYSLRLAASDEHQEKQYDEQETCDLETCTRRFDFRFPSKSG